VVNVGTLGRYDSSMVFVVRKHHGLELSSEGEDEFLDVDFLHGLGHWLGLAHAEEGADSIMLSDLSRLSQRVSDRDALGLEDLLEACKTNPYDESALSAGTEALQPVMAASRGGLFTVAAGARFSGEIIIVFLRGALSGKSAVLERNESQPT
jgi:hypothetical protein